jgi:hypothetical protein
VPDCSSLQTFQQDVKMKQKKQQLHLKRVPLIVVSQVLVRQSP